MQIVSPIMIMILAALAVLAAVYFFVIKKNKENWTTGAPCGRYAHVPPAFRWLYHC